MPDPNELNNHEKREAARMEAGRFHSLGFRFWVDSLENDFEGFLDDDPLSYEGVPMTEDGLVDYDKVIPGDVIVGDTRTGVHLSHPFLRGGEFVRSDNWGIDNELFYGCLGLDPEDMYSHMVFQELGKLTRQNPYVAPGEVSRFEFLSYLDRPEIKEYWGEVGYLHFIVMFGLREVSTLSPEERQNLVGIIRSRRNSTTASIRKDAALHKHFVPKVGLAPDLKMEALSNYVLEDPELSFEFVCYLADLGYGHQDKDKREYFTYEKYSHSLEGMDMILADTLLQHLERHPSNRERLVSYVRDVVADPSHMDPSHWKEYYLTRGQNVPIRGALEEALAEF